MPPSHLADFQFPQKTYHSSAILHLAQTVVFSSSPGAAGRNSRHVVQDSPERCLVSVKGAFFRFPDTAAHDLVIATVSAVHILQMILNDGRLSLEN